MFGKLFKKVKIKDTTVRTQTQQAISQGISNIVNTSPITVTVPSSSYITSGYSYITGAAGAAAPMAIGNISAGNVYSIGSNMFNHQSVVTFSKGGGGEIVRLNSDGTITWAHDIDVDAAAEAFGRSISLGAELQSGITQGVKRRMRDSVFADLIEIAKEKGSLTADDLTYLLEASKIVEKLKGGRD